VAEQTELERDDDGGDNEEEEEQNEAGAEEHHAARFQNLFVLLGISVSAPLFLHPHHIKVDFIAGCV
jgi:hypothetical protein